MKNPNDTKRPNSNSGSLGQLLRSRERLVHLSCAVSMLPHQKNPKGPRIVPWTQKPGTTDNRGRNKAKKEARS